MINYGILNGTYEVAEDKTLDDLKVLYQISYTEISKSMSIMKKCFQPGKPNVSKKSNQPGQLYGNTKTHKFNKIDYMTLGNLKFGPIIAQSGTYTYNTAPAVTEYLKPLCSDNKYIIRNTQEFPKMLHQQEPLSPNEEYI